MCLSEDVPVTTFHWFSVFSAQTTKGYKSKACIWYIAHQRLWSHNFWNISLTYLLVAHYSLEALWSSRFHKEMGVIAALPSQDDITARSVPIFVNLTKIKIQFKRHSGIIIMIYSAEKKINTRCICNGDLWICSSALLFSTLKKSSEELDHHHLFAVDLGLSAENLLMAEPEAGQASSRWRHHLPPIFASLAAWKLEILSILILGPLDLSTRNLFYWDHLTLTVMETSTYWRDHFWPLVSFHYKKEKVYIKSISFLSSILSWLH